MPTRREIAEGLRRLGLKPSDDVVVHSSLKSMGMVDGGSDAVIDALRDALGPDGTLLVPNNLFKGSLTEFLRRTREVDLRTAQSMMGKITETVRLRSDARRSIHASHPVAAIGARAAELLGEHHRAETTCGWLSPYGKLAKSPRGRVLLLGVSTASMTLLHTAEEYFAPYTLIDEVFTVRVHSTAGDQYNVRVRGYCVGLPRNFPALDGILESRGCLRRGAVGNATATLVDAAGCIEIARETILEQPRFLLAAGV